MWMWGYDFGWKWLLPLQNPNMYKIGAYYLSHKCVVKRMKKRGKKK